MSHDSNRTRIWFPMFSYFESSVDGIIPNEYDTVEMVLDNICSWILNVKDCCMLTARRFWIAHNQFTPLPREAQFNLFGNNLTFKSSKSTDMQNGTALLNAAVAAAVQSGATLETEDGMTTASGSDSDEHGSGRNGMESKKVD